jgi:hypothetical protein
MKQTRRFIAIALLASLICAPAFAQEQPLMTKRELSKFIAGTKKSMMNLSEESDLNEAELELVRARYDELVKLLKIE